MKASSSCRIKTTSQARFGSRTCGVPYRRAAQPRRQVKVLLDEMLPIGVRDLLPEHEVVTASYAGLSGISNGAMIDGAVTADFEVIVTLDRGIPHHQNLGHRRAHIEIKPTDDTRSRRLNVYGMSSSMTPC
jgi:hypothetical protein